MKITMIKTELEKKEGTKTVYTEVSKEVTEITEKEFNLTIEPETLSYFRRLGGTETIKKNYTCRGYLPVKSVSTSPDRNTKIIREFTFE